MFCKSCGAENPEGSLFCHNCGSSLAPDIAPEQEIPVEPEDAGQTEILAAPPTEAPAPASEPAAPQAQQFQAAPQAPQYQAPQAPQFQTAQYQAPQYQAPRAQQFQAAPQAPQYQVPQYQAPQAPEHLAAQYPFAAPAKKKKKKAPIIIAIIAVILAGLGVAFYFFGLPFVKYTIAKSHFNKGDIKQAYSEFRSMIDYKDAGMYFASSYCVPSRTVTMPEGEDSTITKHEYTVDDNGFLTKDVATDENGNTTTSTYKRDDAGRILKQEQIYSAYSSKYVYEYEYDDNGYQTHYSSKYYDSEGEVKYTYEAEHELTYDGGNLIKDAQTVTYWSSYSDDDSTDVQESVTEYEYDGKGRLTLQTATDSEGNKSVTEYSYDGKGNMTKTVTTGDKEESNNSTELSYDSKGRITSTKSTSADDTVLTYEIKYDDAGHPSKITMINSGEDGEDKEETYQYKFDSKGNMTSKIYTDPENKDTTYEYEYSDGECTKMIRTDPDGKVTTYEYEDHVYYRTVIDDYQWGPIMKVLYKNAGNYVYLSQYING